MDTSVQESLHWQPPGCQIDIIVLKGDLTRSKTDAIVNAANTHLFHGAGLAGAISKRGGRTIDAESAALIEILGEIPVGGAVWTSGGNLPCQFVIHAVGPCVFHSKPSEEDCILLRSSVRSALILATRLQLTSIGIPGISSGIFGYPVNEAALDIVAECISFSREQKENPVPSSLKRIILMNIDEGTTTSFAKALETLSISPSDGKPQTQVYAGDNFLVPAPRDTISSFDRVRWFTDSRILEPWSRFND